MIWLAIVLIVVGLLLIPAAHAVVVLRRRRPRTTIRVVDGDGCKFAPGTVACIGNEYVRVVAVDGDTITVEAV